MRTRWKSLLGLMMLVAVYLTRPEPAAALFSEWSAPVIVLNVNSEFNDEGPAISKDGRSLYFGSNRPGGVGSLDLWVSQRNSVRDPWGSPRNLGPTVNTAGIENVPAFSPDGHWMFFNSDRAGGSGLIDLWVSYRRNKRDDFGWEEPVNLGPQVNSAAPDAGAAFFDGRRHDDDDGDDLLFFGSNRPGGPGMGDLYVSSRNSDGSFGPPQILPELSSPFLEQRPSIRRNGREIFFVSNRPGGAGGSDLWVATRETLYQVWATPENLGPVVNGPFNDFTPYIAERGRALYFASNRPGGPGGTDLYVTMREKFRKKHRGQKRDN